MVISFSLDAAGESWLWCLGYLGVQKVVSLHFSHFHYSHLLLLCDKQNFSLFKIHFPWGTTVLTGGAEPCPAMDLLNPAEGVCVTHEASQSLLTDATLQLPLPALGHINPEQLYTGHWCQITQGSPVFIKRESRPRGQAELNHSLWPALWPVLWAQLRVYCCTHRVVWPVKGKIFFYIHFSTALSTVSYQVLLVDLVMYTQDLTCSCSCTKYFDRLSFRSFETVTTKIPVALHCGKWPCDWYWC